jgi:hypothetical protein
VTLHAHTVSPANGVVMPVVGYGVWQVLPEPTTTSQSSTPCARGTG